MAILIERKIDSDFFIWILRRLWILFRLTALILSIVQLILTLKSSDLNYKMCTCEEQSCIYLGHLNAECCQEVVTEQWSGQRLQDSKIVICAMIMKTGIIFSIVNISIFTICYLTYLLIEYKQRNDENGTNQIHASPRSISVTSSESESSSNSSFSDQEPNKESDFPPTYEEAVLEF